MSDWTYEPLIVKLKAALAEVDSEAEPKASPARTAPGVAAGAAPPRDSEPDLQRS
jgi:hypothetical protein